jgi:hypothetical protein
MADVELRALKIKANILKRLRKELDMYTTEEKQEQAKVQKLVDEGADPHDIKYAVRAARRRRRPTDRRF